jgi:hypothetical protein
MILAALLFLAPAVLMGVGIYVFARRDDEDLERTWRRLMSPQARRLRQTLEQRILAQGRMITATRRWARAARSAGQRDEATRIEREGQALAERLQQRELLLVRRMLSALRPR